jgi:hypothetical protein
MTVREGRLWLFGAAAFCVLASILSPLAVRYGAPDVATLVGVAASFVAYVSALVMYARWRRTSVADLRADRAGLSVGGRLVTTVLR